MSVQALPLGTQLEEYRIEAVLGSGAFGVTYKGLDTNLGIEVAIKEYLPEAIAERNDDGHVVLRPDGDVDLYAWCRARFVEEAKTLARLRHPGIVRVSRFFQTNGTAYFVMDFEAGGSLGQNLIAAGGSLPEDRVREIFRQVLDGLNHVHQSRYLHRDIKPGNIYIRDNGSVALIDFGAARLDMGIGEENPGTMLTPGYAAPEQYQADGRQGPWSDLYSVGATMYRCLTGKIPPAAAERQSRLAAGEADPYSPLVGEIAGGSASPLLKSVDWMLALEADARPQSVDHVLAAWDGRLTPPATGGFVYVPRKVLRSYKILIAGPVGVGKTTAITTLSDSGVLTTERRASDLVGNRKDQTTVAMDYGSLKISESEQVHIYGIPGQERFDFMWEILQKGAIGLLLLVDNSRTAPLDDLKFFVGSFAALIEKSGLVIGINRADDYPKPGLSDYHAILRTSFPDLFKSPPPVMEIDPRQRKDMETMVLSLLSLIDPRLEPGYE